MKSFFYKITFVFLCVLGSLSIAFAQEIAPSDAKQILTKNLSSLQLSPQDIENTEVTRSYTDKTSGLQLFYLQQTYKGLPVYNSIQIIALKDDKVVSNSGKRVANIEDKTNVSRIAPGISAKDAVFIAAKSVNVVINSLDEANFSVNRTTNNNQKVEFNASNMSRENITAELIWAPQEDGTVKMAWQVKIVPTDNNDYWYIRVNSQDGSVLGKDNLTVSCNWDGPTFENVGDEMHSSLHANTLPPQVVENYFSTNNVSADGITAQYKVVPYPLESIKLGAPVVLSNPWLNAGSGNNAVTMGWHNDGTIYNSTRGNNVWAKDNLSGSTSSPGSSAVSTTATPNLTFSFDPDPLIDISTGNNLKFAITNLFYWNNLIHDITYQYGFDEVSGNFQKDNMGRGGYGNDFVVAEAQNGAGVDNADFSTPSDGASPRMRMFLWSFNPLIVNSPASISGIRNSAEGSMSNSNKLKQVGPVTGDVIIYAPSSGKCGLPSNAALMSGKIALVYTNSTGGCTTYSSIVKNAQNAGAIGVMVSSNNDAVGTMGGTDNSIYIPAIMITKSDADVMKNTINTMGTVNVTLKANFKDGDADNGIIVHEYAHGISNRLTGGPAAATCLQNEEQGGEGWSDYYALMLTTNWATAQITDGNKLRIIGDYVSPGGIRQYPYTTNSFYNPSSYADLAGIGAGNPHAIGERWATVLWDMTWGLIQQEGINPNLYNPEGNGGNSISLKLVTLGMKLQPCSPGFLDARDAILKADQILYGGKYRCVIWDAFAKRGMGVNAIQGSSNSVTDQVADFSVPTGGNVFINVDKTESMQDDIITYSLKLQSLCSAITNYKLIDTLPNNVTWISGGTYNSSNRTVTFNVPSLGAVQEQEFILKVKVNAGSYFTPNVLLDEQFVNYSIPSTLTISPSTGNTWSATTVSHSPSYAVKTKSTTAVSEQILMSANSYVLTNSGILSFWHSYNTEANYDGGVVELSIDNGTTWFDAEPYMIENPYNTIMDASTVLNGRKAYSGNSGGYIRTSIDLSKFVNKSLKFRFRYNTDDGGSSSGWYVDDITIKTTPFVKNSAQLYDGSNVYKGSVSAFTNIIPGSIPVTWSGFTAEKSGNTALLKWSTAQESNSLKYVVERSNDGIQFSSIGEVNAAGNSSSTSNYAFTDNSPNDGKNYYRIRQVDIDGKASYTDIRSLVFESLLTKISISPNPAKDKILLTIKGKLENTKVLLLNTAGQVLSTHMIKNEKTNINLPGLASGVYYLKVINKDEVTVEKLFIQ